MDEIKILHLEDSVSDADIVARVLRQAGLQCSIKLVESQKEYVQALKEYTPDVVISDHSLFEFNSSEALQIFKSTGLNIPFILVTGEVSEEFAVNILKEGADDYLLKDHLVRLPHAIINSIKEKKAQKEKDIASENLRTLFKNIGEAFFSIDVVNDRLLQISDACINIYGYHAEDFFKRPTLWLDVIHPEDASTKEILNSQPVETIVVQYRIQHPDKKIRWVQTKLVPGFNSKGEVIRIDGVTSDITSRKLAEVNLAAKNAELKTLMYRLSHDLRGPITSMSGLVNISKRDIQDTKALKYLDMIEQSNNKLDKILKGIVELVSIDSIADTRTKINFEELIKNIFQLYSYDNDFKKIDFDVQVTLKEDYYFNEQYIHSLLYNLINNAVACRSPENPYVHITVNESNDELDIKVKDNGIGIDEENKEKIFNMFFRVNESPSGSGLGLYIVKYILDKLKGRINVESQPGYGSMFNIFLPGVKE
jgi:PAS domain S-box-containing protein